MAWRICATTMTRDAQMKRAIERKILALERHKDTNCRVYYLEGEC